MDYDPDSSNLKGFLLMFKGLFVMPLTIIMA